jgi:aromatic ring-opening dioxygenase catalytic subunit (LigB family)
MGEIVGAALVSHVPPLVLPEEERRAMNNGEDTTLFQGLHDLRAQKLLGAEADTVVVIDTHWFTTIEHIVASHAHRSGIYTSEELPRGMRQMPYDFQGDPELALAWEAAATGRADTWITAIDDPYLPVHYPTLNLLPFLQGDERWVSVGICQTATDEDFLLFGQLLAEAVAVIDRRVVVLASGGLSHRFWPLRQFRDHEAADPERHLSSPEALAADREVIARMLAGRHAEIIDGMDSYRAHAPEGFFGHYLTMVGAIGGRDCTAAGTQFGQYEAVAGTGQAHIWLDL